jgi:glycosyltransferase involved in cell wall biosynthesis
VPRFSVIIPVFNRRDLLPIAINSVLGQSFRDFEIIIVDDGSTDGSDEVARSLAPDALVLRISNSGPAMARNHGIANATGDYVAFLDSDDAWYTDTLEIFHRTIESHPDVRFVVGGLVNVNIRPKSGETHRLATSPVVLMGRAFYESNINILTDFGLTSVAVHRETLVKVGGFSNWRSNYEDMDLWLRLGNCGQFCFIHSPPLVIRLLHDTNVSADVGKSSEGIFNLLSAWKQGAYHLGLARQVTHLAESALRNMLNQIPQREWWQIYRFAAGAFLRAGRYTMLGKLFAKGIIRR